MVRHLSPDFDLVISDIDVELTLTLAQDLNAQVDTGGALNVEAVILMLPNSAIVEEVLTNLVPRISTDALVIDMSSSEPASTIRLAQELNNRGIDYLDAPVSGGVAKAETGDLTIMCGGSKRAYERALPYFNKLGSNIIYVGESGAGNVAKVLNNLLSATNLASAAEILAVATEFGIEPQTMIEVINNSTGRSQATEVKYPRHILNDSYTSGFSFQLMAKDLRIADRLATDLGITLDITERTIRLTEAALYKLGTDGDHTEFAQFIKQRTVTNINRKD